MMLDSCGGVLFTSLLGGRGWGLGRREFGDEGPSKVCIINKNCFHCEMMVNVIM